MLQKSKRGQADTTQESILPLTAVTYGRQGCRGWFLQAMVVRDCDIAGVVHSAKLLKRCKISSGVHVYTWRTGDTPPEARAIGSWYLQGDLDPSRYLGT